MNRHSLGTFVNLDKQFSIIPSLSSQFNQNKQNNNNNKSNKHFENCHKFNGQNIGAYLRQSSYQYNNNSNFYHSDVGEYCDDSLSRSSFSRKDSNFSDLDVDLENDNSDVFEFDRNNNRGLGNQIVVSFEELALNESTLCLKSLKDNSSVTSKERSRNGTNGHHFTSAPSKFFTG